MAWIGRQVDPAREQGNPGAVLRPAECAAQFTSRRSLIDREGRWIEAAMRCQLGDMIKARHIETMLGHGLPRGADNVGGVARDHGFAKITGKPGAQAMAVILGYLIGRIVDMGDGNRGQGRPRQAKVPA